MLKKNYKGLIVGLILGVIFSNAVVFAINETKNISITYRNIKLVVDGVKVEPKDSNGAVVEPFIFGGTSYLPVGAIAQAFNKKTYWDNVTSTIYIGEKVSKVAKEVPLWDKTFMEVSYLRDFKAYEEGKDTYIQLFPWGASHENESVTYATNGMAKKFKGTLCIPETDGCAFIYKIYDGWGTCLYTSPKLMKNNKPIDIEVDISNTMSIKIEIAHEGWPSNGLIKNPRIVTTEY